MSEIKYEIVKKIGVLSSPLRPSDTSPKSRSDLGEAKLQEFSVKRLYGLHTIYLIASPNTALWYLGRLEGQDLKSAQTRRNNYAEET